MEILSNEKLVGAKNCSHCNFQDFHSLSKEHLLALVRTFLKIGRLGGWGWKIDPDGRPKTTRAQLLKHYFFCYFEASLIKNQESKDRHASRQ